MTQDGVGAGHRLTVLAGPTAVGKGTVAADIRARYPQVWLSVSVTTRLPRLGEQDGKHYHFVDDAMFDAMVAREELLEWAVVHGHNRYGTPRRPVEVALAQGRPTLLEIDLQGARQVRRLIGRGTESAEERERRLHTARLEMAAEKEFDVTIVNADVHQATDDLVQCMGLTPSPAG